MDGWQETVSGEAKQQKAAGKGLRLQHGTYQGSGNQGAVPHAGTDASVTHLGFGGCKLAVPVQKTQDLCV